MIATDMQSSTHVRQHRDRLVAAPGARRSRSSLGALAMEVGERLVVAQPSATPVQVRVETELGAIVLELDPAVRPERRRTF